MSEFASTTETTDGALIRADSVILDGHEVKYTLAGSSGPYIFSYSLATADAIYFPAMMQRLAGVSRLLVAGWPVLPTIQDASELGAALIRQVIDRPAIWMGSSVGGSIAQCAAVHQTDTVNGLILSNTALPVRWASVPANIVGFLLRLAPQTMLKSILMKASGPIDEVQRKAADEGLTKSHLLAWLRWAADFHALPIAQNKQVFAQFPALILESSDDPGVHHIANDYMQRFTAGEISSVHVVYMNFISVSRQKPEALQLLPLKPPAADDAGEAKGPAVEYDFSPPAPELLADLLPVTVRTTLFQAFLDAVVSEHIARMVAMKAATDNASKMGKDLSRRFNRARQTQITTELTEIISGAAALE